MATRLATAQAIIAAHQPEDRQPGVCPVCTRRGVGSNGGPVSWQCAPYSMAARVLREAGQAVPAGADDEPGEPEQ